MQATHGSCAHLAAQVSTAPASSLLSVEDIYSKGLRAPGPGASPAGMRRAWEFAASSLVAQVAADVRGAMEALGDSVGMHKAVVTTLWHRVLQSACRET